MARRKNFVFEGNSDETTAMNASENAGGSKFIVYEEGAPDRFKLKGSGDIILDIIPFDVTKPAGVSVETTDRNNRKNRTWDNSGCYIKAKPNSEGRMPSAWQLTFAQHTKVGAKQATIVCPSTFGKACPICEAWSDAAVNYPGSSGDPRNKVYHKEVVTPLAPKQRTLHNIVVRDGGEEEEKGVQLIELSWHSLAKHLIPLSTDRRSKQPVRFYYPDSDMGGKSIVFDYQGAGTINFETTGHGLLDRDKEITDDELDMAIDPAEFLKVLSYDEIKEMVEGAPAEEKEEPAQQEPEGLDDLPWSTDDIDENEEVQPSEEGGEEVEDEKPVEEKTAEEKPRRRERSRRSAEDVAPAADVDESSPEGKCRVMLADMSYDNLDAFCEDNDLEVYPDELKSEGKSTDEIKEVIVKEFVKVNP